jgi:hypothetical protein
MAIGVKAGELFWRIAADAKPLGAAVGASRRMVDGLAKSVATTSFSINRLVGGIGLAYLGKQAIRGAMEQERAENTRNAVLRATGEAAGFNAAQLNEMASALQRTTKYGDELTIASQGILASFTNVRGKAFERTIKAAGDLAAVMGGDLKSSVYTLGRALNDPAVGLSLLSRQGVAFTAQQQAQIKLLVEQNRLFEAQAIILAEVERKFGGAAAAAAKGSGQFRQLGNSIGDLGEVLAAKVLATLAGSTDGTWSLIGAMREYIDQAAKALAIEQKRAALANQNKSTFEKTVEFLSSEEGYEFMYGREAMRQNQRRRRDILGGVNTMSVAGALRESGASDEAVQRAIRNQRLLEEMKGKTPEESQAMFQQMVTQNEISDILSRRLPMLDEQLAKLDDATRKEFERQNAIVGIEARQMELSRIFELSNASQQRAIFDELTGLDKIKRAHMDVLEVQRNRAAEAAAAVVQSAEAMMLQFRIDAGDTDAAIEQARRRVLDGAEKIKKDIAEALKSKDISDALRSSLEATLAGLDATAGAAGESAAQRIAREAEQRQTALEQRIRDMQTGTRIQSLGIMAAGGNKQAEVEKRRLEIQKQFVDQQREVADLLEREKLTDQQRLALQQQQVELRLAEAATLERMVMDQAKSQAGRVSFAGVGEANQQFQVALLNNEAERQAERQIRAMLRTAEEANRTAKGVDKLDKTMGRVGDNITDAIESLASSGAGAVGP